MSKRDSESQSAAQETTAESPNGATNSNSGAQVLKNQTDLLRIDVNDHIEKKNGLSYLSWAWAWAEVLKVDPQANFEVVMFHDQPYMTLHDSHMVWVTVTIFGKSVTCQLPVLDYRNKCIPKPNAFDINTTIMRCLTKGIALHGLGLYIYAGEDLPMQDEKTPPSVTPPPAKAAPEEPKAPAVQPTDQQTADAQLFYDAILEYMKLSTTERELRSYWKENQFTIDQIKVSHPALYSGILAAFKDRAAQLKEKT